MTELVENSAVNGIDAEPYWEVYPNKNDVGRCDINDTIMLMEMIQDDTNGEDDEQGATDKGTDGDGAEVGTGEV
jgi:hypothetical protein